MKNGIAIFSVLVFSLFLGKAYFYKSQIGLENPTLGTIIFIIGVAFIVASTSTYIDED